MSDKGINVKQLADMLAQAELERSNLLNEINMKLGQVNGRIATLTELLNAAKGTSKPPKNAKDDEQVEGTKEA